MNFFLELIRNQFKEEIRASIHENTDFESLEEWTSLQIMVIVNEIDIEYNVILNFEDIKRAKTVSQLYHIVQNKLA